MPEGEGKTYRGYYSEIGPCYVEVDGEPLDPRLDLYPHSLDGFQWGYGGSGPAQLALAILADCLGDDVALRYYQQFKWDLVAHLPKADWELDEVVVHSWVEENGP